MPAVTPDRPGGNRQEQAGLQVEQAGPDAVIGVKARDQRRQEEQGWWYQDQPSLPGPPLSAQRMDTQIDQTITQGT
ncbi:hypothetical protein IP70_06135 [alpha proteobacterium AAP38]|nr:hypothetical protein IP70_06135 [alpha proteobacterium AAP38]